MTTAEMFVNNLINTQALVQIGSVDEDGFPNIRAKLKPLKRNGIKEIYFSTHGATNKVKHFIDNPKASLYLYDAAVFKGAMLKGKMEILTAREDKQPLWQPGNEMHYPGGVDDPNFCVLKFTASSCRCYNQLRSKDYAL